MDFDRSCCSFTLQSRSNSSLPSLVTENNSRGRTFCEEKNNWPSCWKVFFMTDTEFQSGWEANFAPASVLLLMLHRGRAAGPFACERIGELWKEIPENFVVILYLSNPSIFGLVGVCCDVLYRCACELPSCLSVAIGRLLMFLPQLSFPGLKPSSFFSSSCRPYFLDFYCLFF